MYFWRYNTPITFLACCIWNLSEFIGIGLGRFAPHVFDCIMEQKGKDKLQGGSDE